MDSEELANNLIQNDCIKEGSFQCSFCGNKFSSSRDLIVHFKKSHAQEKSYQCNLCEAKFLQSSKLTRHIKTVHRKDKPFVCDMCPSLFSRADNMKSHKKRMHEKIVDFDIENDPLQMDIKCEPFQSNTKLDYEPEEADIKLERWNQKQIMSQ